MKCRLVFLSFVMLFFEAAKTQDVSLAFDINQQDYQEIFKRSSYPRGFTTLNHKIYFGADDGIHGIKLWEFNGTDAPHKVSETLPYTMSQSTICRFKDKIYFNAQNNYGEARLWVYDGTHEPYEITGFPEESNASDPLFLTVYNDQLFFITRNDTLACLWKYDEENGPVAVKTDLHRYLFRTFNPMLTVANNKLYFVSEDHRYSVMTPYGLNFASFIWEYDGINEPQARNLSWDSTFISYRDMESFKGKLYFSGWNLYSGYDLWEFDGSSQPRLVKDIVAGSTGAFPVSLTVFNDHLYFFFNGILYRYDGNNEPEQVLSPEEKFLGEPRLFVCNNQLFISGYQKVNCANLWKYHDQDTGGFLEKLYSGCWDNQPGGIVSINSRIYFNAQDSIHGDELWVYCPETESRLIVETCESYLSPSGKVWTESGVYTDTIPNAAGCDSIITVNLTILTPTSSAITATTCSDYTSPGGKIWTGSGVYTDTIPNAAGCDSIITVNLTIIKINTAVHILDYTLTAEQASASYQWLDCDNNYLPVEGKEEQSFEPLFSGSYAVEITLNGCADTSDCYPVEITSLAEKFPEQIEIYPNPGKGIFTVELGRVHPFVRAVTYGLSGLAETEHTFRDTDRFTISIKGTAGLYFLKIFTDNGDIAIVKIFKE